MIESDGYQRDSYATDDAPAAADQEDEIAEILTPGRACRDYVSDFVERFADAYRGEMEHFVRAVRGREEPRPSGTDAAAATVLTRAAERSYREGRTVRLKREIKDGEISYEEAD